MPEASRAGFRLNRTGCVILFLMVLILGSVCLGWTMFSFGSAFTLLDSVGMRFRLEGFAMEPSLRQGSFILVNRQAYLLQTPRRGDIVVYRYPRAPARMFVHRVIGLPGETVQMREGKLVINGAILAEPYVATPAKYEGEWILKSGEYFVLGDNRNGSSDSHSWGPLPVGNIAGKAEWIYWPPKLWGSIPGMDYAP